MNESQETQPKPEAGQPLAPTAGSVDFHVNYYSNGKRTHGYDEHWEHQKIHCPNCGQKAVWVRDDGDYYVGPEHICAACANHFYMPTGPNDVSEDAQGKQRLAAIRSNPQNDQAH